MDYKTPEPYAKDIMNWEEYLKDKKPFTCRQDFEDYKLMKALYLYGSGAVFGTGYKTLKNRK